MRRKSGWIEKLATAGVILGLLGGSWLVWDHYDYPLPSFLDPSYDPFAAPPGFTALQQMVFKLRIARNDRILRKIDQRNAREREAELIQGFREFRLAGLHRY